MKHQLVQLLPHLHLSRSLSPSTLQVHLGDTEELGTLTSSLSKTKEDELGDVYQYVITHPGHDLKIRRDDVFIVAVNVNAGA